MAKKLFFAAPLCALILMLASCSLFSDVKENTSVSFTIDSETAQNLLLDAGLNLSDSNRTGIGNLQGLYINLSLRGTYPLNQIALITANGATITFAYVPVENIVYAYAEIYSDPTNVLYKGISPVIKVVEGSNNLRLTILNKATFDARYPNEPSNPIIPTSTPGSNGNGTGGNGGDNGNGENGGGGGGGNTATADPYGGPVQNLPDDPDWFNFQSRVEVLAEGTQSAAEIIYNNVSNGTRLLYPAPTPRYVKFGNYPRTHKDSSVTIDESVFHTMGNFTYYKGDDNNWYAKFKVKKNSSTTYYNNGTDSIETNGNYAYFKLEPITWRVLTTNYKGTGKALLVTDEALPGYFDYDTSPSHKAFSYVYNSEYSTPNRTIGGVTIYKNNYQYSDARAWLNGLDGSGYDMQDWTDKGFLNSAFTEAGRMRIAETVVDNSAQSCYPTFAVPGTDYNNYISANTTDKVFILSANEITNPQYGFYEPSNQYNSRCYIPTDLALASNAQVTYNPTTIACCYCYLRSPNTSDTSLQSCGQDGAIGSLAASVYDDYSNYFAPAICIDLSGTTLGKVGEGNAAADSHGLLPGIFTVDSSGKQVKFSQSNLWKNSTTSTEYHFVSQQYYYSRRNKDRDTTGNYKYNHDLFEYMDQTDISNISIAESDITNWRLLTADEWQYLFEGRTNAASKFGVARINNFNYTGGKSEYMTGFILLPDSWTAPAGISFTPGWMAADTNFPTDVNNTYDSWDWKKMEEAGAVFLPAGGYLYTQGSTIDYYCSQKYGGRYWNASDSDHVASIDGDGLTPNYTNSSPYYPIKYASIRLVQEQ